MPTILTDFRPRRGPLSAAAPLIAGCLLLAGCGGSSNGSGKGPSGAAGTTTTTKITGSALGTGLLKTMAVNEPQLKDVKVSCPDRLIKRYPVNCRFSAVAAVTVKGKNVRLPSAGKVHVLGVQGTTIKYQLLFGSGQ